MAENKNGAEQTEAPTPKKLADAAKQGDRPQGRELAVAAAMGGLALWLAWGAGELVRALGDMTGDALGGLAAGKAAFDPGARLTDAVLAIGAPFALMLAATMAAAVAAPLMIGGAHPQWGALAFKSARLNPAAGFGRMFGAQGWIELAKALAKTLLVGGTAAAFLGAHRDVIMALGGAGIDGGAGVLAALVRDLTLWLVGALMLVALIDTPVALWRRIARLRMSLQEVRDEHKEAEGSPEMKGQQRSRRMALLSGQTRKGVQGATFILTNPTHFAVALRYRPGIDAAPVVTARGADDVALAIRALARARGIMLVEQPLLARAAYFTSKPGQMIDRRLFEAVAAVLAFVWRVDRMAGEALPPLVVPRDLRFDGAGKATG
ncbi:MAG: flagellar biosynthetic protein FlhB [Pseudomonadota bacterium]